MENIDIQDFFKFLDIIEANLIYTRYANQNRWNVSIENCAIQTQGCILEYVSANSKILCMQLVIDYIIMIEDKKIVINANNKNRREYKVPKFSNK